MEVSTDNQYNIGLALSGGGVKGICHVGVLTALEEVGIKPQIIAGTSAGAIIGALYADGYDPKEILKMFAKVKLRDMVRVTRSSSGFLKIRKFERFLEDKLRAKTFEDLKIPLRVVATDLESGKSKIFSSGELLPAVIASCSIPVLFIPKVIDDRYYVDGAVVKNFPVSVIRNECNVVIGVNAEPKISGVYEPGVLHVGLRAYNFMLAANTKDDRKLCDYLIEPKNMASYELFDLHKMDEIFDLGYHAAKEINIIKEKYE